MLLDDAAVELARAHRLADPRTTIVKYFPGGPPIRLVQVSSSAPTAGEVLPFAFAADGLEGLITRWSSSC